MSGSGNTPCRVGRGGAGEEWLRPFLRSACVYSVDNECVTVQEQEQGNERPGERGRQKESSSLHYIVTRAKIDHRAWSHAEGPGNFSIKSIKSGVLEPLGRIVYVVAISIARLLEAFECQSSWIELHSAQQTTSTVHQSPIGGCCGAATKGSFHIRPLAPP